MGNFRDVVEFNDKFGFGIRTSPGHLTRRKLQERIDFMQEELNEFIEGVNKQNLAEQADALIDLAYVAMGTAHMLGLPWEQLWSDVHRANMAKVRGIGKRGHLNDCIKPADWVPPNTMGILIHSGYSLESQKYVAEYRDDESHENPDNF